MPLYDLAPGRIVETDRILSEDDVDAARTRLARGDDLEKVARWLGGHVHEPADARGDTAADPHVLIRQSDLVELLGQAGYAGAELERALGQLLMRAHGPREA